MGFHLLANFCLGHLLRDKHGKRFAHYCRKWRFVWSQRLKRLQILQLGILDEEFFSCRRRSWRSPHVTRPVNSVFNRYCPVLYGRTWGNPPFFGAPSLARSAT